MSNPHPGAGSSRRTVLKGAAWSVPVVAVTASAATGSNTSQANNDPSRLRMEENCVNITENTAFGAQMGLTYDSGTSAYAHDVSGVVRLSWDGAAGSASGFRAIAGNLDNWRARARVGPDSPAPATDVDLGPGSGSGAVFDMPFTIRGPLYSPHAPYSAAYWVGMLLSAREALAGLAGYAGVTATAWYSDPTAAVNNVGNPYTIAGFMEIESGDYQRCVVP